MAKLSGKQGHVHSSAPEASKSGGVLTIRDPDVVGLRHPRAERVSQRVMRTTDQIVDQLIETAIDILLQG